MIYSSGSVQAQMLLFKYSEAGDLTTVISISILHVHTDYLKLKYVMQLMHQIMYFSI